MKTQDIAILGTAGAISLMLVAKASGKLPSLNLFKNTPRAAPKPRALPNLGELHLTNVSSILDGLFPAEIKTDYTIKAGEPGRSILFQDTESWQRHKLLNDYYKANGLY